MNTARTSSAERPAGKRPLAALTALIVFLLSAPAPRAQDAPRLPDVPLGLGGATLLPNGWRVTPAGRPIPLPGDLPLGMTLSPDGKFLLVNTGGWHDHYVDVIDLSTDQVTQSVDVDKNWAGMCFDKAGDELYVAAGQGYDRTLLNQAAHAGQSPNRLASLQRSVLRLGWSKGFLMPSPPLAVPSWEDRERWTAGPAAGRDDSLYVLEMEDDQILRLAPQTRAVHAVGKVGYRPCAIVLSPDGNAVAVANWGDGTVSLLDAQSLAETARVRVGLHPNALAWAKDGRLYVANAASNSVSVLQNGRVSQTVETSLVPRDLVGSTPDALALSPDGTRLYVANADNNDVAVLDISDAQSARVLGFIPTGWYPTALAVSPDGKKLYVGVGKGLHSRSNVPAIASNPRVTEDGQRKFDDIGRVLSGAVSVVDVPDPAQLSAYTQQVRDNIPTPPGPSPLTPVEPIKHVVYIIREGRSYDQILGDIAEGNGDPTLALFGRNVTPNAHALAQNYVLLDNLYANGEVGEDGHAWCDSAWASDFLQRVWPGNDTGRDEPDADARLRASPAGSLWDDSSRHGVTFYSYGEQALFEPRPNGSFLFHGDRSLIERASAAWTQFPADAHDTDRVQVFLHDLREAEKTGQWPQLVVMSLGEDGAASRTPGQYTALAHVAANDQALGQIVAALSHSPFWRSTAIFVIEADARQSPDHVDAHRVAGLVISPYVQRHRVDSTLYTTASFLRTIELLLSLPPLTQYDSHAASLDVWTAQPIFAPYTLQPPHVNLDARNP